VIAPPDRLRDGDVTWRTRHLLHRRGRACCTSRTRTASTTGTTRRCTARDAVRRRRARPARDVHGVQVTRGMGPRGGAHARRPWRTVLDPAHLRFRRVLPLLSRPRRAGPAAAARTRRAPVTVHAPCPSPRRSTRATQWAVRRDGTRPASGPIRHSGRPD
jgi:hypothetical protein